MTAPVSQSTLDALADAETLRRSIFAEAPWSLLAETLTDSQGLVDFADDDWTIAAVVRRKAHAAFRAVPGLREP